MTIVFPGPTGPSPLGPETLVAGAGLGHTQAMKRILLAVAATLCAGTLQAKELGVLYAEPEDGLFIVRDASLAGALRDSDRVCEDYSRRQEEADRAAAAAAAQPARQTLQREKAGKAAAAIKSMSACLDADKSAKRKLAAALGAKTAERLQKAAAFEDMVLVQLIPADAGRFEAQR
jgi:hypothetical protein